MAATRGCTPGARRGLGGYFRRDATDMRLPVGAPTGYSMGLILGARGVKSSARVSLGELGLARLEDFFFNTLGLLRKSPFVYDAPVPAQEMILLPRRSMMNTK